MGTDKLMRLSQIAKELNVAIAHIVEVLATHGFKASNNPNAKISDEQYKVLLKVFESSILAKKEAQKIIIQKPQFVFNQQDEPVIGYKTAQDTEPETNDHLLIKNVSTNQIISLPTPLKPTNEVPIVKDIPPVETVLPEPEPKKENISEKKVVEEESKRESKSVLQGIKVVGKIDLKASPKTPKKTSKSKKKIPSTKLPEIEKPDLQDAETLAETLLEEQILSILPEKLIIEEEPKIIQGKAQILQGLKVVGKIELKEISKKPVASSADDFGSGKKRKRRRIRKGFKSFQEDVVASQETKIKEVVGDFAKKRFKPKKKKPKDEISEKELQDQIKSTLARLSEGKGSQTSTRARYRKEKRDEIQSQSEEDEKQIAISSKILNVSEFVTANDLASMMDVPINEIISACLQLGMMVSINQRLDAEVISIIAEEFGYKIQFVDADEKIKKLFDDEDNKDNESNLQFRAPIVTVMGHVDHGKTSLLDFIRRTNVVKGEAGGITQHIGAYDVTLENGKKIAFIDTPGHEAFTAMRARGAKVTDIVILVVAADDGVMPQTIEAINHAQAAKVPIVIAVNKIDKENANPDKIKEQLANLNILVEEWGGKYQSQHISAKFGKGINDLLEKVLLEAELLDLKANPDRKAKGTVIESRLDRGRGMVATLLVQKGSLKPGQIVLAGHHFGKIKAMYDNRGEPMTVAGPSTPVLVLGFNSAPQAGDNFIVMDNEKETRSIANEREQLVREQAMRTRKHITLEEIGRRLALGNFKELNIIVKGDVVGSIEAMTDSFLKLSTDKIKVNIIHKGVGQITESDIMLASASDAIIVGFQVRPSITAKKMAEREGIEIRLFSIIYDAIGTIKTAMEGMLTPEYEEKITSNVEVREIFKIPKLGTIAGCMVLEGSLSRNNKTRVIRDGIVIHTGELSSLRRYKEDVTDVKSGFECGLSLKNFNDLKVKDIVETFEDVAVKTVVVKD